MTEEPTESIWDRCWMCKRTAQETDRDLRKLVTESSEIENFKDEDKVSISLETVYSKVELYKKADSSELYHHIRDRADIFVPLCSVCAGLFQIHLDMAEDNTKAILEEDGYITEDGVFKITRAETERSEEE